MDDEKFDELMKKVKDQTLGILVDDSTGRLTVEKPAQWTPNELSDHSHNVQPGVFVTTTGTAAAKPAGPRPSPIYRHMLEGSAEQLNAQLQAACLKATTAGLSIDGYSNADRLRERSKELTTETLEAILNTVQIAKDPHGGWTHENAMVLWAIQDRLQVKEEE